MNLGILKDKNVAGPGTEISREQEVMQFSEGSSNHSQ